MRNATRALAIALAWSALVLVPDIVVRVPVFARRGWPALVVFGATAALALLGWQVFGLGVARWRPRHPWLAGIAALSFGVLACFSAAGMLGYHAHFGLDPGLEVWGFCLENPRYALALALASAGTLQILHLVAGPFLLFAVYHRMAPRSPNLAPPGLLLVAGALPLVLAVFPLPQLRRAPLPADLGGLRAIALGTWHYFRAGAPRVLPLPRSSAPPSRPPLHAPDVVLLIHESLSDPGGDSGGRALAGHEAHSVRFARATAVSNATGVAVPTLLTGLSPEVSRDEFARAPLVWQWARAHGYTTALFSAQDLDYQQFRHYLLEARAPDVVRVASDFDSPGWVNDLGIEDGRVVDAVVAHVSRQPRDRPLFLVVQFNATH